MKKSLIIALLAPIAAKSIVDIVLKYKEYQDSKYPPMSMYDAFMP